MDLSAYLKSLTPEEREDYATRCQTTVAYLYQIAGKHSSAGGRLARKLAEESGWQVTVHALRPDIFGEKPEASA